MLLRDGSHFPLVALVNEAVDPVLGWVLFGLLHPVAENILKRLGIGWVIYQNHCVGSFVVGLSDAAESLLSSSVPDLQFDEIVLDVHGS